MTTPTNVPTLKFAVPGAPTAPPPLPIPAAEEQPIATGLATVSATQESRQSVSCKDMLPDDQLRQARVESGQALVAMLDNTQVVMSYGVDALDGVNRLIDRLMKEIRPATIPELKSIMTTLTLNMKSIKGKYDLSTPEGRRSYDDWENSRFKKLFRKGRNYITAMLADMTSVDTQLDKIAKDLNARKLELIRNVAYLDQLYKENEVAIYQLIYKIAVMECIAEEARRQAAALPPDDSTTGQRNTELRQQLADLILQMDVKIGEYKGRLFVAWATSPQVRMMRVLNVGMAEKVNEAVGMTIPTMKLAIVQWRILAETQEAAKAAGHVADATNVMLRQVAQNSAIAAGAIMEAVQTPTILPETVTSMTESMVLMADNILTAIQAGDQRRAELDKTMAEAKVVLDGSQAKFNQQVVDRIVASSTKPVAIPPSRLPLALPSA